jgi:hypothetical protein
MARPPERDELDSLLNAILPFAQDMIAKRGEFLPFGAVLDAAGSLRLVAADIGSEYAESRAVIGMLRDGMKSQAASGEIRAAGLCFDVRIRDQGGKPTDAIEVDLEHRAGDAAQLLMPYAKRRFGAPRFGELIAGAIEPTIFPRLPN